MANYTYTELTAARAGLGLDVGSMARLLGVSSSTYKGWRTRGKVPNYIAASVEAHLMLDESEIAILINERLKDNI